MKVKLDPQPCVRVALVATVDPEAERAVDLRHTNGHMNTVAVVEVALECAGLDGSEERVLDVDGDLIEAGSALTDVDLAGKLWIGR